MAWPSGDGRSVGASQRQKEVSPKRCEPNENKRMDSNVLNTIDERRTNAAKTIMLTTSDDGTRYEWTGNT